MTTANTIELLYHTDPSWVEGVVKDFPKFLADHAANERKVAATCMDFVVRYPDRLSLVAVASKVAQEEIAHFRQVFDRMQKIGAKLLPDEKDEYVARVLSHVRPQGEDRLLDRLIVASVFEARGVERFGLLSRHHPDPEWREFYGELSKSEERHREIFLSEARRIFSDEAVRDRTNQFLEWEAEACRNTPLTWRFH